MTGPEPPDWALPAWDEPGPRVPRSPVDRAGLAAADLAQPGFAAGRAGPPILGVSDVTRAVREAIRGDDRLRDVWVEGEVGRVTISSAGHGYFTLQDARSQLSCVFFRDDRRASPFQPQPGLRVVARGRVDVFDSQGVYQLYVASIQPAGFGDLALRFEALKARLASEGLFDASRKRRLPDRPSVVGVVTSPSGAVWHDIRQVMARRWPLAQLLVAPCVVQGDAAPGSIVVALDQMGRWVESCRRDGRPDLAPSVTIVARGGGSLEDLWPFNDEAVVRAIVRHPVPVVAGIGHEVDVTLADFAADVRAPTPSAAAELCTPDRAEVAQGLATELQRLRGSIGAQLRSRTRDLAAEHRALTRLHPAAALAQSRERAGALFDRASRTIGARLVRDRDRLDRPGRVLPILLASRLSAARSALETTSAGLLALGPQATLERGYAIVRRSDDGLIVRSAAEVAAGAGVSVRVARGQFSARVEDAPPAEAG